MTAVARSPLAELSLVDSARTEALADAWEWRTYLRLLENGLRQHFWAETEVVAIPPISLLTKK